MKKITAILLTFLLSFSAVYGVFADDITETLSAIGILPGFSGGDNDSVTKEELAFMTAELADAQVSQKATRFYDVAEDNKYSGHIEYLASLGIISGDGEGNFHPKSNATYGMAAKMIVNMLGFGSVADSYGGYPVGYTEVLNRLGLDRNVSFAPDRVLTVAQAKILFHNVLTMEYNDVIYASKDGETKVALSENKNNSLLAEAFGISVYEVTITNTKNNGEFINVIISRNKYDSNPVKLETGSHMTYALAEGLSAEAFLNVPAIIWVNEDETVLRISPQKNVEIRFVNISSVNGDTNENNPYAIGSISEMTFLDDEEEYTVSENAVLAYNGAYTTVQKELIGNFAKIVLCDDEITFIESWDLEKGGLITDFNGSNITYLKNGNKAILRDISSYDKVVTIIGKRMASLGEITKDTLFSYYKNENYIVIVASERKIVDKFVSVSKDYIDIGEMSYLKGDILYTEDEKIFTTDYVQFLNRTVAAYVGPDGKIWYIKSVSGDSAVSEFYGIVSGIEMNNMDPEFGQIELYKIEDQKITKERYEITDKTVYNDLLSLDILSKNAKNTKGEGVYIFKVNASGKLISVSLPQPLYGFATAVSNISYFDENAFLSVDGKGLYFSGQPILAVYKDDNGQFAAEFLSYSSLSTKSVGSGTIRFFGKGKDSVPSLIVLSGDLSSIGSYDRYGVITNIMDSVNADGDLIKLVTVISMHGTKEYKVLPEDAKDLKENMWITFRDNVTFSETEIIVRTKTDLSGNYQSWDYKKGADTEAGLHMGIAETADKNRILLKYVDITDIITDEKPSLLADSAYYFHPSQNFFIAYYPDAPVTKFKPATFADVDDGDTVFWNYRGDGVRGVIIVKD